MLKRKKISEPKGLGPITKQCLINPGAFLARPVGMSVGTIGGGADRCEVLQGALRVGLHRLGAFVPVGWADFTVFVLRECGLISHDVERDGRCVRSSGDSQ